MGLSETIPVGANAAARDPATRSADALDRGEVSGTRGRILQIALTLMSQRGVDGTSMRDLASAAGLNVASLYHYFPSKSDLLESVLVENGLYPVKARRPKPEDAALGDTPLAILLTDILESVFRVEEFVRLMVGEAIRHDATARSKGQELFATFEVAIEDWIARHRPDLDQRFGPGACARLITTVVVGVFVQYAAGAIDVTDDMEQLASLARQRAREVARILEHES